MNNWPPEKRTSPRSLPGPRGRGPDSGSLPDGLARPSTAAPVPSSFLTGPARSIIKTATAHRAILRNQAAVAQVRALLCVLFVSLCAIAAMRASLVTGNVLDIGLAPLETKITFYPTNEVLVTGGGLSAGPAKTLTCTNGSIYAVLDAGCYNVSFPLVPWRKSFLICVGAGQTNNITNFMSNVNVFTNTTGIVTEEGDGLLPD